MQPTAAYMSQLGTSGQVSSENFRERQATQQPAQLARALSPKAAATLRSNFLRTNIQQAKIENLDDDTALAIARLVRTVAPSLRAIDFEANTRLSVRGWTALFEALARAELRLRELRFRGCGLDDARVAAVAEKLASLAPTVEVLDVSGNSLVSPTGWSVFLTPLARRETRLEELSLSGNGLEDVRIKSISMQLMNMGPTVKNLYYSGNPRLSTFGWTTILRPLTGTGSRFEDVRFSDCDLDDNSAKAIFAQFVSMGPTIRRLNFEGNKDMTSAGWYSLLSPLTNYDKYRHIEEVNFGNCDLNDEKALTISRLLNMTNARVKKLDFGNNGALSAAAWQQLLVPFTGLGSCLGYAGFANCELSEASASTIGDRMAAIVPTMRRVEFGGNKRLTKDGWMALIDPLTVIGIGVEDIDLGHCDLDDACARTIGERLHVVDTSVKKLSLGGNMNMTQRGWISLLEPLTRFSGGLEEINFHGCSLADSHAIVIGEQIGNLVTTLRKVNFRGNSGLSEAAWAALLFPLTKYGTNLEEIDFSDCKLDAEKAKAIGQVLMRLSPSVKTLSFRGKFMLSPAGWQQILQPLTWDDPSLRRAIPLPLSSSRSSSSSASSSSVRTQFSRPW